jgi:putative cytidylate kinase
MRTNSFIPGGTHYRIPAGKVLRIAISGASGCGNTTVSTLLAEVLGIPCINYTFRTLAKELNMPLSAVIEQAKTDFRFDRLVDERQVAQARQTSCVLGSRLAIWLLKEADLKVYLHAPEAVRIGRIVQREGGSVEAIRTFTQMRDSDDTRRYKELYNIDNTDYAFADLKIDTEHYSPVSIVELIIAELLQKSLIQPQ